MTRIIVADEFSPRLFERMIAGKILFERLASDEFGELIHQPFESAIHSQTKALIYSIQLNISFEQQLKPIEPIGIDDIILLGECENTWQLTYRQALDTKIIWWKITHV